MSEVMTVEQFIQQMEFAQYFLFAFAGIAAVVLLITEVKLQLESHRIWKELRKMEKEKLEIQKKIADKEFENYGNFRYVNVSKLNDQLTRLRAENDSLEWHECILKMQHFIDQQFMVNDENDN